MTIDVSALPETEQVKLFLQLKRVWKENPSGLSVYLHPTREKLFSRGYACVHCGTVCL